MHSQGLRLWQTPLLLSSPQAKFIAGLGVFMLVLAASGIFLYDGWPRIVHVSALTLLGLTNLILAVGSGLPEEQSSIVLQRVLPPLVLVMFVALVASTAIHWRGEESISIGSVVIGGIAGGFVPWVLRRMRR